MQTLSLTPACRLFSVASAVIAAWALVSPAAAAGLDTTAPSLTSFGVSRTITATAAGQYALVKFSATDNLSGIYDYYITLESPSGLKITQAGLTPPALSYTTAVQIGYPRYNNIELGEHFWRWSEPGTWAVTELDIRDLAGNSRVYDRAALAALGATDFTVVNSRADGLQPVLVSGLIETPVLALSTPPAGLPAGALPVAKASIKAYDQGVAAVSGIDTVSVFFCKEPFDPATNQCADMFGLTGLPDTPVGATAKSIPTAGLTRRENGNPVSVGTYRVWAVVMTDVSGQSYGGTDIRYGGAEDFSILFPSGTTITINP